MAYGLGVTLTCNSKARDGMTFMEHQNKPFGDVETYIYMYIYILVKFLRAFKLLGCPENPNAKC